LIKININGTNFDVNRVPINNKLRALLLVLKLVILNSIMLKYKICINIKRSLYENRINKVKDEKIIN